MIPGNDKDSMTAPLDPVARAAIDAIHRHAQVLASEDHSTLTPEITAMRRAVSMLLDAAERLDQLQPQASVRDPFTEGWVAGLRLDGKVEAAKAP